MRKIKEMQADHFYMIRGASSANSPFFESTSDCKLFLDLAERFLGDYLKITCFQNNRDGWVMLIATRSAVDIKRAYYARRARSTKCQKAFEYKEVWRMLSDQIRIFLSTYVKTSNYRLGRIGGKVRCRYERFLFENEEEAVNMRDMLESIFYLQAQPLKRYRPAKKLHKFRGKILRRSVYVCSWLLSVPVKMRELGMSCVDVTLFSNDVVRQLVLRTLQHHFPT